MCEVFSFLQIIYYCPSFFFYYSCPTGHEMVAHRGLIFIFLSIFSCTSWCMFFRETSIQILCPLFYFTICSLSLSLSCIYSRYKRLVRYPTCTCMPPHTLRCRFCFLDDVFFFFFEGKPLILYSSFIRCSWHVALYKPKIYSVMSG